MLPFSSGVRSSNKVRLVIFDLDGTLVDAYEAIIKSVNFTLKKIDASGLSFSVDAKRRKNTGYLKISPSKIRIQNIPTPSL